MSYSKQLAGTDVIHCLAPVSSHQSGIFWGASGCNELNNLLGVGYASNSSIQIRLNKKNLLANLCRHYGGKFYVKDAGTSEWKLDGVWLARCNGLVEASLLGDTATFITQINRETTRTYIKGLTAMSPQEGGQRLDLRELLFEGDTLIFDKDAGGIINVTVDLGRVPPVTAVKIPSALPYSKSDFLNEVFIDSKDYDALVSLVKMTGNIVLQGPPGVGKTFAAKRFAWSVMGGRDDSHVSFVQFHQSYCYEDFVLGFKPTATGFEVKEGIFFQACKQALQNPAEEFFFIIDEINRGNLSRIFGELLMLIENDKRGTAADHPYTVKLPNAEYLPDTLDAAYAGEFFVPDNLYIIGMMNTADRSLAMIDYALRRRFAFYEMVPAFDSAGFKAIKPDSSVSQTEYDGFIQKVKDLNEELSEAFGSGFCIGHSYFCKAGLKKDQLKSIVEFEIYPMLKEYWFDDTTKPKKKYDDWKDKLIAALH